MAWTKINDSGPGTAKDAKRAVIDDGSFQVPRVDIGPSELGAVKDHLGQRTWEALRRKLLEDGYVCEAGICYLKGAAADFEAEKRSLEVGTIEKLMPLMYCRRLRASVLKGIANRTDSPDVLSYLSDLDSTYLLVYDNHELRKAVALNRSSPDEIISRYAEQSADAELRDFAAGIISALRE